MQLHHATAILLFFLFLFSVTASHDPVVSPEPCLVNITTVLSRIPLCKVFAHTLLENAQVLKTYQNNVDGGLTMFCPLDDQFEAFLPKFENLTEVGQQCFLEFFAVPYYQTTPMLKTNNGILKTLANLKFTVQNDGQDVTLKTKLTTAKITGTSLDELPLAIHTIDRVLMPDELFHEGPESAPVQAPAGNATEGLKQRDTAVSCEGSVDHMPDEDNSVLKGNRGSSGVIVLSLFLGILL